MRNRDLNERKDCANSGHSFLQRVVHQALERDRAVLCRAVSDLTTSHQLQGRNVGLKSVGYQFRRG